MNELTKKTLLNLSNSAQWQIIKDGYLLPILDDVKDVSKPLVIGNVKLDAEKSYYAKGLTAIKLREIINTIDRFKNRNTLFSNENFE